MKRASKRRLVFLDAWSTLRLKILARDGFRCRHCAKHLNEGPLEVHHVAKRSQRKDLQLEESNLVTLCRLCHAWTDAPYAGKVGRLVVVPCGEGRFVFKVTRAADKFEARGADGVGQNG